MDTHDAHRLAAVIRDGVPRGGVWKPNPDPPLVNKPVVAKPAAVVPKLACPAAQGTRARPRVSAATDAGGLLDVPSRSVGGLSLAGCAHRERYGTGSTRLRHDHARKTVMKWRARGSAQDAPMGPKTARSTVPTPQEEAMAVASALPSTRNATVSSASKLMQSLPRRRHPLRQARRKLPRRRQTHLCPHLDAS